MNRVFKTLAVAIFAVAALLAIPASAFAEGKTVRFTVTAEDGTVTEYYDEAEFASVASRVGNNEKITLCSNITVNETVLLASSADSPKNVTLDLAGYGIATLIKTTVFSVKHYVTFNVYSSAPDAYLYVVGSNASLGGNMFSIIGNEARVNFGDMTVGDVTYPGSNISTFSSCFIDVRQSGTQGFFGNGGNHYANIRDWNAFICARTGEGRVEMKNSNIIVLASNALLYNEVKSNAFLFENCVIINMSEAQEVLIKNTLTCPVTMKDCVTNFCLGSSVAGQAPGIINLIGDNVFGTEIPMDKTLLAEGTTKTVAANINHDIRLIGDGYDGWYFDNLGKLNKIPLSLPEIYRIGVITSPENAVQYTWNYEENSTTELWYKGEEPIFPYQLPNHKVDGMYRYGWAKTVNGDGSITYIGGKIADFDISVSAVYDGTLYFKIYIPAYVIDEGYLLYSGVLIAGAAYYADEWERVTVDGEDYYSVKTLSIDEERFASPFDVVLPFDFPEGKGQSSYVTTTWRVMPSLYIERVLDNPELYDADAVGVVKDIANAFMNTENE
ncbi:MAG: hypothetical protein IKD45_05230 [Clostridia bacterium]|nr:hypothetical protein [Clostridia bacterium]